MITLGHGTMKAKNYKLAIAYYKKAEALNPANPLIPKPIKTARKKLREALWPVAPACVPFAPQIPHSLAERRFKG